MSNHGVDMLFDTDIEQEIPCSYIIRVAFESGVDKEFDYFVPDELWPIKAGQRVEVPFGRKDKLQIGFCVVTDISHREHREAQRRKAKKYKLKKVSRVVDKEPLLNDELMELARWISSYYICPLGQVLAAMVPSAVKKGVGIKKQKLVYLSVDYKEMSKQLRGKKQKQIVEFLQNKKVFDIESAIETQKLLGEIGCTNAPLKKLAENRIIKITEQEILVSLPVIPDGLSLKTETICLNEEQEKALVHFQSQIDSEKFAVTLLYGVTDSGKNEVYIRAVEKVLQKKKTAIVLLPEIALTAQTVQRFSDRFKRMAVMHSGLTAAGRNVQWQKIKSGQADVVVGARSAVFAPLNNLGLIVVDEEHEHSYKQDTVPRYHGRDVAIKRAQLAKAHCILGSATPSLETLFNCKSKKFFSLIRLPKRVKNLPVPEMKLVDLKQTDTTQKGINLISEPLVMRLKEVLAKGEQGILLLNRRGYSNFVFCPSCRHMLHCRNCDVMLTFHKSKIGQDHMQTITGRYMRYGYAACHYCGAQTLVPEKCPLCGKGMAMIGFGSQRLEEELSRKFPNARIARIDSDSMAGKDYYHLLKDFGEGRIDILAGTQMLAKGLHFPNVTVVGIISADTCLYLPDFRANERTFQLICQVAGRTGRSEKEGVVFVQTFLSEQPAIQFALDGNFEGFVEEELKHRRSCDLPPFWRLAVVVMRDSNFEKLEAACKIMRDRIDGIIKRDKLKVKVRGPLPAVISRIQRFHRMQIIVQAPEAVIIQSLFNSLRKMKTISPVVKVAIDIDPVNLL